MAAPALYPGEVVANAHRLLGAPFHPRGRSAGGVDCVGLLVVAFEIPNPNDPAFLGYSILRIRRGQIREALERYGFVEVPLSGRRAGDVVTFHHERRRSVEWHAGIVVDGGDGFIHVTEDHGKVVRSGFDAYWSGLAHSVYRPEWWE